MFLFFAISFLYILEVFFIFFLLSPSFYDLFSNILLKNNVKKEFYLLFYRQSVILLRPLFAITAFLWYMNVFVPSQLGFFTFLISGG